MSTVIEDPGIPLVNANGGFPKYTESMDDEDSMSPHSKRKQKKNRFENVGLRLAKRKYLFTKRRHICDVALILAIIGILLMVIETECFMMSKNKNTAVSYLLKIMITFSTVALCGMLGFYHYLDIKLYMVDNSMEDWRLAMTTSRVFRILLEFLICAIHPPPGNHEFVWRRRDPVTKEIMEETVPVDVIFGLPMFLRLYLVCRAIMLHSKLYTDASSQSLGALNRINFNFRFIFKSMMTLYPETVLTVIITTLFIMASWALRACEMYHEDVQKDYLNAMWVVSITFLSVGYGDIVPTSYCGRVIAVLTGIFGAGCTALLVAVLARKLELSRAEKYVHNFVIDVELDKKQKHAAANIVKQGWMIYKLKRLPNVNETKIRKHQMRLLKAIHNIREVKTQQRRLMDSAVTLVEMAKSQQSMHNMMSASYYRQKDMEARINGLEASQKLIDKKLNELHRIMTQTFPQR